jgi:hypothetical protein
MSTQTSTVVSLQEALRLLDETNGYIRYKGSLVKAYQMSEPFILIVVATGTQGSDGEAGDWIIMHPDGYPTIVTNEVVMSRG